LSEIGGLGGAAAIGYTFPMCAAVIPPIGAIAVAARRNRIIRGFRKAAALSPESAQTLESLARGHIFGRMVKSGVIKEETGGRFWLDEAAEKAGERARVKFAVIGVISGLVVVGVILGVVALVT